MRPKTVIVNFRAEPHIVKSAQAVGLNVSRICREAIINETAKASLAKNNRLPKRRKAG